MCLFIDFDYDIDVYLSPLVEDLRKLWDEGIVVFDAFRKETFQMRAMLFCTINDFPAMGISAVTVLRDIMHAPSVKKTQATYN